MGMHQHRTLYSELHQSARHLMEETSPSPAADFLEHSAHWLSSKVVEMLPMDSSPRPVDLSRKVTEADIEIRFAKELDAFEIEWVAGNVIHRDRMKGLIVQLARALDEAEQVAFTCTECFAELGWKQERGFRRCLKCGYPRQ